MAEEEGYTNFCAPNELVALTSLFKGNVTAAQAFCEKLTPLYDVNGNPPQYQLDGLREGLNTFFLTINGALVFVMHAGFAMVRCARASACLACPCIAAPAAGWPFYTAACCVWPNARCASPTTPPPHARIYKHGTRSTRMPCTHAPGATSMPNLPHHQHPLPPALPLPPCSSALAPSAPRTP